MDGFLQRNNLFIIFIFVCRVNYTSMQLWIGCTMQWYCLQLLRLPFWTQTQLKLMLVCIHNKYTVGTLFDSVAVTQFFHWQCGSSCGYAMQSSGTWAWFRFQTLSIGYMLAQFAVGISSNLETNLCIYTLPMLGKLLCSYLISPGQT